jgi:hypothetical protein
MIQVVEQPYFIPRNDVDTLFEGKLVLLAHNSDNTADDLLVAYSDGNSDTENEDRESLYEILRTRYNGNGIVVFGYVYDGSELVCI